MDTYRYRAHQNQDQWGQRWAVRQWNPPQGHGVYLFVKFPGHSVEFAAQTVVLGKRAVTTARGEFIGIARKVHDLSSGPRQKEALVVIFLNRLKQRQDSLLVTTASNSQTFLLLLVLVRPGL
uniref:Uncharacterized protein n=1 Tax=Arion vulgaris TaxID=1028688 RepID=A0A0B6ZDJ9_9EUPU